ncbi:unnamed protein product, partial [Owenia fusiformis]
FQEDHLRHICSKFSHMLHGPMVYGIAYCPISMKDKLKDMGLADSKTLSEEKRESLMNSIDEAKDYMGWIVNILAPNAISNGMLRRCKYNLNAISHDTAIGLVQKAIEKGVNVKEVYVDTVGPPEKYQAKLEGIFPDLKITVAKKADALYSIVSGASICAKVCRDHCVKEWEFKEGIEVDNFGSGYPGDPNTKNFMKEQLDPVFGFPQLVRFGWSTAYNVIDEKCVSVCWEDDEDEEEKAKRPRSVLTMFSEKTEPQLKRHKYFKDNCLKNVDSF